MAREETVVVRAKVEGDSKGAVNAVNAVDDATKETTASTKDMKESQSQAFNALDKATGGAVSGMKSLAAGISTAVKGLFTMRGAIIATGVGALLVAITSLVSYFTKTERGAQTLRVATAALGAVLGEISDVAVRIGEGLVAMFTNPKQALIDFGNFLKAQIINRLEGIVELIPALGRAVTQLFKGDFSGAAKNGRGRGGKTYAWG